MLGSLLFKKRYEEARSVLEDLPEEEVFPRILALSLKLKDEEKVLELYHKYYKRNNPNMASSISSYIKMRKYLKSRYEPGFCSESLSLVRDDKKNLSRIQEAQLLNRGSKPIFSDDVDLLSLYYQVKTYIIEHPEKSSLDSNTTDIYYFYLLNCGRTPSGGSYDYFKVCTLINESSILAMYPTLSPKNVDLCYLEKEDGKSLIKIKSGLERFQARYSGYYGK